MQKACNSLLDYVNGALSEEDAYQFEKHKKDCAYCQEEFDDLMEIMDVLPFAAEPVHPPDDMKARVLPGVEEHQEDERVVSIPNKKKDYKHWVISLLAAGLLFSISGHAYSILSKDKKSGPAETVQVIDQVTRKIDLQGETAGKASAAFIKKDSRMTLVVEAAGLEPLEGEEVYQVWLIEGEQPHRAGSFVTNSNGEGAVSYTIETDRTWEQIAISKEPNATSEAPRGDVMLSSTL
ncbi:anti-sigma factor [Pontibacillus yanchengensis]|uniref:Regulator of SigK n=1 Tax=Pontibacillus yanchengensis Y32 TaxID=1385514 RepID=A0A0A2TFI4_9BACI|nr:anti-sigma factor [Pontibacillus yanchengensis]KGP74617.1 hypothetical protein N782_00830 [Pontibacillus yanchengensis Y32]